MKTIHTPLLALAALTLLPATGWSQDRPERERPVDEQVERLLQPLLQEMREGDRELQPEARRMLERAARERGNARTADQPWRIGVMVDPVDPLLRTHLQLPENSGVVVDRVIDGSPAAKAGLRQGDLILAAWDKPVGGIEALRDAVNRAAASGKPLILQVLKAGKKQSVRITPPAKPEKKPKDRERSAAKHNERKPSGDRPAADAPQNHPDRMGRALREMRADLDKQREAIRRLEKRVEEMSRKRD